MALAGWIIGLGAFLMLAPDYWFSPTWSYFTRRGEWLLPSGGLGMGISLALIGGLQLLVIWRRKERYLAPLLFLAGFVFWVSGLLLGAEGIVGHQDCMAAPFMIALGVHKFVLMANAAVEYRAKK